MPEVMAAGITGIESVITVDPDPKEDVAKVNAAKEFIAKRFLTAAAKRGVPYKVEIAHFLTDSSSVGDAIVKRAEALDAFCVCMAKHNRGTIAEFFIGSTTKYVSNHGMRPLVVLH